MKAPLHNLVAIKSSCEFVSINHSLAVLLNIHRGLKLALVLAFESDPGSHIRLYALFSGGRELLVANYWRANHSDTVIGKQEVLHQAALALRNASDEWIRERMTVVGLRTVHELRGIEAIFQPGYKYNRAGVLLTNLAPAASLTMQLWGNERLEGVVAVFYLVGILLLISTMG